MSFKQFITESEIKQFGKLTHLEHVEDMILHDDHRGYEYARDVLHAVHDRIQGKPTTAKPTIKFDGSPSILFGTHPETGKFFVGTKSALNPKNPTFNYTKEDLAKNYSDRPGLYNALSHALEHLPKVSPRKGIYQGDLMYTGDSVHEDDKQYHFTPNTLMYSVDKDTPEGKKIKQSQMGIVVHTRYHGNDIKSMVAGFEPDLHNFKTHKDVNIIDPQIKVEKTIGGPDLSKDFHKHMQAAEMAKLKAHPYLFKDTVGHKEHLKRYINNTVREGEKPTPMGFKSFLMNAYSKESDKLKTSSGIEKKREQLLTHLQHIDNHHDRYQSILNIQHHLQQAKHVLIKGLDQTNIYKTSVDGKDVGGEGFVVVHQGYPSKLVNRQEFSRTNFEKNKNRKIQESYIIEGGNIKIGEQGAVPIDLTQHHRKTMQQDIHNSLSQIHHSFKKEYGHGLFGENGEGLHAGSVYSGSTKHLMNHKISDKEFSTHKKSLGDVDVQIPKEHAENLNKHLSPGKKFGNYEVIGTKKHGNETTALMKHHPSGHVHQFDFEHVNYHNNEPTKFEQFSHGSSWEDTKHGIKGVHHKMLLNAAGGQHYKFSPAAGIKSRTNENDPGDTSTHGMTHKLFGSHADSTHLHSFIGLTHLIKNHIPKAQHQDIYNKFKESVEGKKKIESSHALHHLKHNLDL
jgi:hypothetical protein